MRCRARRTAPPAMAAGPSPAPAPLPAATAGARARSPEPRTLPLARWSPLRPAPSAAAEGRSSPAPAGIAAAREGCERTARSTSRSRRAWRTASTSSCAAREMRAGREAESGDLYVVINVMPHPKFQRVDSDLLLGDAYQLSPRRRWAQSWRSPP